MAKTKQTILHLHFPNPSKIAKGVIFSLGRAGFSDEEKGLLSSGKLLYPYPGTFIDELARRDEDRSLYLVLKRYQDNSIQCPSGPKHSFQSRVREIEAEAFGGMRVVDFVTDDGADFFTLSTQTAARLRQSSLTGFELLPINLDLSQYRYRLPCSLSALGFIGQPCSRIASVIGDNRCSECGKPDLFCSQCGHWFYRCPRCNSKVHCIIQDDAVMALETSKWSDGITYPTQFILDGDRYDGSDFIAGEFVSAEAVNWLFENGVYGFSAQPCVLVYK